MHNALIVSFIDTYGAGTKLCIDRHLLGHELSGLTVGDLQFLQSQVEMSLQSIRKEKVTLSKKLLVLGFILLTD
jgi:hypothetical protein